MQKGFVYIGRMVDHAGNFVGGYHKIGKSIQYKVRETQLNSTHLPIDVLFVRVFEAEDMDQVEQIYHVCFEDYRVIKQYDYRKDITTEWFDVLDTDTFNARINKIAKLMNLQEVDVIGKMKTDKSISQTDIGQMTSLIKRNSASKIIFTHNGEDLTQESGKGTFVAAISKIAELVGWDQVAQQDAHVSKSIEDFGYDYDEKVLNSRSVWVGEYVIWTYSGNQDKVRKVNNLIHHFQIPNMTFEVQN
jgi:hypothetical protein